MPFAAVEVSLPRNTLATTVTVSNGRAPLARLQAVRKRRRSRGRLGVRTLSANRVGQFPSGNLDLASGGFVEENIAAMNDTASINTEEILPQVVPSDTHIALMALRADWPGDSVAELSRLPPIVLVSQLYALVADRAAVDREVDAMRAANVIRYLKLPASGEEEHAVVLTDDLRSAVARNDKLCEQTMTVFFDLLLPECTQVALLESDIYRYFGQTSDVASELIRAGLLTMKGEQSFLFSVPYAGYFVQMRRNGNKELSGILQRAPYKEMLLSKLELRRLRSSSFPALFHIRDVIGSCGAETVDTTLGKLVRIRNEAENGWLV